MRNKPNFWDNVDKCGVDDCWLWTGVCDYAGYGQFYIGGKSIKAHRYSWELAHASKNHVGFHVCHTCDRPRCVNPSHLFLGTASINMQDARQKGRMQDLYNRSKPRYCAPCGCIRAYGKTIKSCPKHTKEK